MKSKMDKDTLVGKLVFNLMKDEPLGAYFDKIYTQSEVGVVVEQNKNKDTTWGRQSTFVIYWFDRTDGSRKIQEYFSHHVSVYEPDNGENQQLYIRDRLMIEWYHNEGRGD